MNPGRPLEIAIVGMGCRFPDAPDLFAYWQNVLAGRDGASGPIDSAIADVTAAALDDAGLTAATVDDERIEVLLDRGSPPAAMPTSSWASGRSAALGESHAREDVGMAADFGPSGASSGRLLARAAQALTGLAADLVVVGEEPIDPGGRPAGATAMVLKRRADAERDGDRIYAVVRELSETSDPAMPGSGLAGLIRAALALYHRVLPPDLHAGRPWIHADSAPRRVGTSLAVLEEHAASADAEPTPDAGNAGAMLRWETEAILLSAPDRAGLADRVRELIAWLEEHPGEILKDIAYTLNCGEDHADGGVRLGLVASSTADLAARLSAALKRLDDPSGRPIGDGRGTYHWDEPLGGSGGLAFLFPGEGSQYPGMLADLCIHFPEVRRQFDTADRIALDQGDAVTPSEQLFGGAGAEGATALWSAPTAVNLILNAQWALYQVLTRLGLHPDAVAGHSSGEILSMAAAGVLRTDRELERQLGRLGAIFRNLESAGDMPAARLVAVAADRNRVEAACREAGVEGVAIAIDNCPHQVVVAGPTAEVDRVVAGLRAGNVMAEVLPFDRPYHTPDFAAVLGPIADSFAGLTFRTPRLPVYSCATRERMPADPEAVRELAIAQWTRTVAFRETIEAMHADGLRIFVDVGARGNLAGFVQDTLRGRPAFAIAANLPRRGGLTQLNHLVAALFAQGVSIRPGFLYARRRPRLIEALVECPVSIGASLLTTGDRVEFEAPPHEPEAAFASIETSLHPRPLAAPAPLPLASRFRFDLEEPESPTPSEMDATMLAFQETMRAFLETQQAVLGAYLGSPLADMAEPSDGAHRVPDGLTSSPAPGPWVGEVRRLVPGSEVESIHVLDVRTDPIAEHHTLGGRKVSALDPTLKGLPVLPFAVMAEMTAQAGALVVSPGLVLTKLTQLKAHKWVRYEDEPVVVELRGQYEPSPEPGEERVRVALYNRGPGGRSDATRPVFEAVAVFAAQASDPPMAGPWHLEGSRPCRFTSESMYAEQWLFHGPAMQAVSEVGRISENGIDGALRVLPWEPLVDPARGRPAHLHTDVIVIDSFTHLLGCWGLDHLADRGDVVFPLHMEELLLYGDRPAVGTDVACRIAIQELQRHRLRVEAEIVRPDGTVWMRLHNWEDWRFHWPGRYRDVFRQPRDHLIGEEWPLEGASPEIRAVWLAPPADMGRPVWRDVLEQTQLGPAELAAHLAMGGPEDIRSRRLWGRIAAREAARRIWQDEGRPPIYPADLAIVEERGRPVLTRVEQPGDRSLPAIAMADADGVAVAIAVRDPGARPGVAVATIAHPTADSEESGLSPAERDLLARWAGPTRRAWAVRFHCAREAAIQSAGLGFAAVVRVDEASGVVLVGPGTDPTNILRVATGLRGEYAWAWTLGVGVEP